MDIEITQKVALRLILYGGYTSYQEALQVTGLETLKSRRNKLCLSFAKKCTKSELTNDIFPLNTNLANTRNPEMFHVTPAKTERLKNSAIPYMQRLLNDKIK